MTGMAISTASDNFGLVTIIMTAAPIRRRTLRNACEIAVLAAAFT